MGAVNLLALRLPIVNLNGKRKPLMEGEPMKKLNMHIIQEVRNPAKGEWPVLQSAYCSVK